MTIQGAVYELESMLSRTDIPDYIKPTIKKVIETILDEFHDQRQRAERYKPIVLQEHDAEPRTLKAILDTATDEIYICRLTKQGAEFLGMTIEGRNADEEVGDTE